MENEEKNLNSKKAKGKHAKKKKSNIFIILLRFLFIALFIFSSFNILKWVYENKKSADLMNSLNKYISVDFNDSENITIDFEGLKKENNYCFAWLIVNGTDINYPVVHYTNNDFYMTHLFDNSSNSAGCPFADYRDKCDGTDKNLIIYAHNRRDGSMFGTLQNALKQDWYTNENNLIIELYTPEALLKYKVFSVYELRADNSYTTISFASDNVFLDFIEKLKSRSIYNFNVDLSPSDKILTLSTCSNNNAFRTVLHAKLIN